MKSCPLNHRAFPSDVWRLGGIAQLAGVDLENILPRTIKDHPWIGELVTFPRFAKDGYKNGKIMNCLVHPTGYLMFDVQFPELCPPLHYGSEIVLRDEPKYYQQVHRFSGEELANLVREK